MKGSRSDAAKRAWVTRRAGKGVGLGLNLLAPKRIGFKHKGMSGPSWWNRVDLPGGGFHYNTVKPRGSK